MRPARIGRMSGRRPEEAGRRRGVVPEPRGGRRWSGDGAGDRAAGGSVLWGSAADARAGPVARGCSVSRSGAGVVI